MRTLLATLWFLTMAAVQARAEVTVKEYKARMASSDAALVFATKYYVRGLGRRNGMGQYLGKTPTSASFLFTP
jgi:hypothetical protein